MKQIAIIGNKENGKDVISALELLGGCNIDGLQGIDEDHFYYVKDNGYITGERLPMHQCLKDTFILLKVI